MNMKKIIRLTESDLHRIIKESVYRILKEDGEAGGGGATNAAGVMQGGGTNPGAGQYDVPAFGGKTNKKKADGFGEPIMRQAHNLGDVTQAKTNQVDMGPALKRGGSIAMGESIRRNKMIDEAVDEGIGNWLKGAALGGMMALSPMQGNAQTQNYNPQQNDTVQVSKSNFSKEANRDLSDRFRKSLRNGGMSDKDVDTELNTMSKFNAAYRNGRDESNDQIREYLYSVKPNKSTKNIHVSRGSGNKDLRQFLAGIDKATPMKYKAFILPDEVYVVMPVNYTLQDVQAELGL